MNVMYIFESFLDFIRFFPCGKKCWISFQWGSFFSILGVFVESLFGVVKKW